MGIKIFLISIKTYFNRQNSPNQLNRLSILSSLQELLRLHAKTPIPHSPHPSSPRTSRCLSIHAPFIVAQVTKRPVKTPNTLETAHNRRAYPSTTARKDYKWLIYSLKESESSRIRWF